MSTEDTQVARTLPELVRLYSRTLEMPPAPEDYDGVSRPKAVLGFGVVVLTALAIAIPLLTGIEALAPEGSLTEMTLSVGGFIVAIVAGHLLGSPLADRLLGIPRVIER